MGKGTGIGIGMNETKKLFETNPNKFRTLAKGKTFKEFIMFLETLPTFKIVRFMSDSEKLLLYSLAKK